MSVRWPARPPARPGTVTNSPAFPVQRAMRAYGARFPTSFASPTAVVGGKGGLNGVPAAFDSMSRQVRQLRLYIASRWLLGWGAHFRACGPPKIKKQGGGK